MENTHVCSNENECTCISEDKVYRESQYCNQCGENVSPGSGKFVNRIPDFNSVQSRIENNRPFPEGDFVCAECDAETSDNDIPGQDNYEL